MQKRLQNLYNFIHDNFVNDKSVIGLCGLKKQTEYTYVTIPKDFKKTHIQNIENNYLLLQILANEVRKNQKNDSKLFPEICEKQIRGWN